MLFQFKGDEVYKNHGPKTLLNAVHKVLENQETKDGRYRVMGKVLAHDDATTYVGGHFGEINASTIQTALIQSVGRFCESFASDLICTLSDLQPFIHNKYVTCSENNTRENPEEWVIGVGIRDSGVDHNEFIISRLKESRKPFLPGKDALSKSYVSVSQSYRKLLAIYISECEINPEEKYVALNIYVVDITHDCSVIDPADE